MEAIRLRGGCGRILFGDGPDGPGMGIPSPLHRFIIEHAALTDHMGELDRVSHVEVSGLILSKSRYRQENQSRYCVQGQHGGKDSATRR